MPGMKGERGNCAEGSRVHCDRMSLRDCQSLVEKQFILVNFVLCNIIVAFVSEHLNNINLAFGIIISHQ